MDDDSSMAMVFSSWSTYKTSILVIDSNDLLKLSNNCSHVLNVDTIDNLCAVCVMEMLDEIRVCFELVCGCIFRDNLSRCAFLGLHNRRLNVC